MSAATTDSAPAPAGWVVRRAVGSASQASQAPEPARGSATPEASDASAAEPRVRIFGLSPEERLLRALRRAGCIAPRVVDPAALPPADGDVLAVRGDVIVDERLIEGLRDAPGTLLATRELGAIGAHVPAARASEIAGALARDGDSAPSDLRRAAPAALAPSYVAKLRKREPPYVFPARPELAALVERRTFAASYKGLTDLVTKWVWPRPAAAATRWCAERGVHPNTVTLWSWALAIAVVWLFWHGATGAGLVCAWAMTFLDTVDGKLARVTLTSSRTGDVLDHGLDLVHPPFWWWAFGAGLGPGHGTETAVVVLGYLLGRGLEGAFLARFGFEIHSWQPADGLFRTVTARRNPNLILLSVGWQGGRPDLGLVMVALWTLASLGFHGLRLLQAERRRAGGVAIAPWEGP